MEPGTDQQVAALPGMTAAQHRHGSGLRLRPFVRSDEAAVRQLFVRSIMELAPPAMQDQAARYVSRALAGDYRDIAGHYRPGRGRGFWVALSGDGALAGNFGLEPSGADAVELRRMYVAPCFRRRGVARAMLAEAEAACIAWGVSRLFLTTSSLNTAAVALYRSAGYRQMDHVPGDAAAEPIPPGMRFFIFEKHLGA